MIYDIEDINDNLDKGKIYNWSSLSYYFITLNYYYPINN